MYILICKTCGSEDITVSMEMQWCPEKNKFTDVDARGTGPSAVTLAAVNRSDIYDIKCHDCNPFGGSHLMSLYGVWRELPANDDFDLDAVDPKTQEEWIEARRQEARDKSKIFENTPGVIDAGIVEGPVDFPVVSKLDDYEGD